MTADQHSRQPRGNASRRRRTSRVGQKWQPLAHRRGLVIGDVIDPRGAALECRHRSGRRVSDVDERPDPGAVANDRELPSSNRVEERAAAAKRCSWTVEPSIAQSDRFDTFCGLKCRFQVANRIQRPAKCRRGLGIQWIVLRLDGSAGPLVGPAGKALRDDSPHAGRPRGREKIVSALGSQPIRQGKLPVEPAKVQVRGDRRQLVHNRVGSGRDDGPDGRLAVQCIQDLCLYPLPGGDQPSRATALFQRRRAGFAQQRDEMLPTAPVAPARNIRMRR